ncbi:MAG: ribbon-helix-helix protein, CopG family [Bryobacterales bacterium]|nr:ribbon-helix-helix protein, CopG family [Bryobacterales bacterium]
MATQNTIHLPDELLAELRAQAAVEGKSVDELAAEAVRGDRRTRLARSDGYAEGADSGHLEGDARVLKRRRSAWGH